MKGSRICAVCLRTITNRHLRSLPVRGWQPKAGFVSLSAAHIVDDDSSQKVDILPPKPRRLGRPPIPNWTARARGPRKRTRTTLLEDLFEQSAHSPAARKIETDNISIETYGNAEILGQMLLDKNKGIDEIWDFFLARLGPQTWISKNGHLTKPILYPYHAAEIYTRLLIARGRKPLDDKLPPMAQVLQVYQDLGMMKLQKLCQTLTHLLKILEKPLSIDERQAVIEDVLSTWRTVYYFRLWKSTPESFEDEVSDDDWAFLPRLDTKHGRRTRRSEDVEDLLQELLPFQKGSVKILAPLAVKTFALASNNEAPSSSTENPFLLSIAHVLSHFRVKAHEINVLLNNENIVGSNLDADQILKRAGEVLMRPESSSNKTKNSSAYRPSMHRRLVLAQRRRDSAAVDALWKEVQEIETNDAEVEDDPHKAEPAGPSKSENSHVPSSTLTENLCNHFILANMALGQSAKAIDVWNVMIQRGMTPSLATWNAMLEGCGIAKDSATLESVWARCINFGEQPDMELWTTRISGLMTCGKIRNALQALMQMGSLWEEAANKRKVKDLKTAGDIDGVVKPSIGTINAVLVELLRHKRHDQAQKVLAWGHRYGIKADIYTFNTLLRSLVTENKLPEIVLLLQQMQKQGVPPDVATFTTLIDELFKNDVDYSLETQSKLVDSIFDEMAAAGVKANEWTYSKIIHSLLHGRKNNTAAVKTVLDRMAAQGLAPSSHLCTALVDWYFAQVPPNLDAVGLFLERAKTSEKKLDYVFWNRVVGGYAIVGDTVNALRYLPKVNNNSTWTSLTALVLALVRKGELDTAKELVRDTEENKAGPPKVGDRCSEGQELFWETVENLDLLETEDSE